MKFSCPVGEAGGSYPRAVLCSQSNLRNQANRQIIEAFFGDFFR